MRIEKVPTKKILYNLHTELFVLYIVSNFYTVVKALIEFQYMNIIQMYCLNHDQNVLLHRPLQRAGPGSVPQTARRNRKQCYERILQENAVLFKFNFFKMF